MFFFSGSSLEEMFCLLRFNDPKIRLVQMEFNICLRLNFMNLLNQRERKPNTTSANVTSRDLLYKMDFQDFQKLQEILLPMNCILLTQSSLYLYQVSFKPKLETWHWSKIPIGQDQKIIHKMSILIPTNFVQMTDFLKAVARKSNRKNKRHIV